MIFTSLFLMAGGVFSIWCAYKDYDWFMNNYKARIFVKMFGRDGARLFYMGLGVFIVLCAVAMLFFGS